MEASIEASTATAKDPGMEPALQVGDEALARLKQLSTEQQLKGRGIRIYPTGIG